ncbi:MAG: hypothetical protein IPJ58_17560 [Ardenticatenia bacterium]|nr:hypothetical protein [Ardenticatenia bacterium]
MGHPVIGPSRAAVVDEGIAYWVQGQVLLIWNLTRIGRQGLLGTIELPEEVRPGGLTVSDGIATVLSEGGFILVDVREATAPEVRQSIALPGVITAFKRHGSRLYVATDPLPDGGGDGRVQVFDVGANGTVWLLGNLEGLPKLTSFFAEGERLWAAANGTVLSLDVASGRPRLVDRIDGLDQPIGVFRSGDRLWVVNTIGEARSWPLLDDQHLGPPTNAGIPLGLTTGSRVLRFDEIVASDGAACAFTAVGFQGFQHGDEVLNRLVCLDLTDPQSPVYSWLGYFFGPKPFRGLSISGGVLAVPIGSSGGMVFANMTPRGPGFFSGIDPSLGITDALLVWRDTLYSTSPSGTLRAWHPDTYGVLAPSAETWTVSSNSSLVSTVVSDRAEDLRWLVFARQSTFGTSLWALDLTDGVLHDQGAMPLGSGEARASDDLVWFPEADADSAAAGLFALSDSSLQRIDLSGMAGTVADVGWSRGRPVLAMRTSDGVDQLMILKPDRTEVEKTISLPGAPTALVVRDIFATVAMGTPWSDRESASPRDRAQLMTIELWPAADPVIGPIIDLPMTGVVRVQATSNRMVLSGWSVEAEGPERWRHWICDGGYNRGARLGACLHQPGEPWTAPSWALSADGERIYRANQGIWTLNLWSGSLP